MAIGIDFLNSIARDVYATRHSASLTKPIPSSAPSSRSQTWAYSTRGQDHQVQGSRGAITLEKSVTSLYVSEVLDRPTRNTELCVKNICHVVGPVSYAPVVGILLAHTIMNRLSPVQVTRESDEPGLKE